MLNQPPCPSIKTAVLELYSTFEIHHIALRLFAIYCQYIQKQNGTFFLDSLQNFLISWKLPAPKPLNSGPFSNNMGGNCKNVQISQCRHILTFEAVNLWTYAASFGGATQDPRSEDQDANLMVGGQVFDRENSKYCWSVDVCRSNWEWNRSYSTIGIDKGTCM